RRLDRGGHCGVLRKAAAPNDCSTPCSRDGTQQKFQSLATNLRLAVADASEIAFGMGQACDDALPDRIRNNSEYDRRRQAGLLETKSCRRCHRDGHVGLFRHDTSYKRLEAIRVALTTKQFNLGGPTILVTAFT